ncbi:MAG TPA: hypothetical protein VF104_08380, partial [Burkholderiales bacterium]
MSDIGFGLSINDLYQRDSLVHLDTAFLGFLGEADVDLRARLEAARADPALLSRKDESALLVALAPHLEDFLARLFRIEAEARALAQRHHELAPLHAVKRNFVQRRALHKVKAEDAAALDGAAAEAQLVAWFGEPSGTPLGELAFAR